MNIEPVRDAKSAEDFLQFSFKVYRDNPYWAPPLLDMARKMLLGKGLFFKHCVHAAFLVRDGGQVLATAAAFYDQNFVSHWNKRTGFIGYFEALPKRPDAVKLLLHQCEQFLKQAGAEDVWAPFNGYVYNPVGLLADSYNQPAVFLMNYNPAYYHPYFRENGYKKVQELLAYTADLLDPRLQRKVNYLNNRLKRSQFAIRPFNMKKFESETKLLKEIYSETYKNHWGFAGQTDEEAIELVGSMKAAMDPDIILFAELKGKVVGFTFCMPDFNPIIKRFSGELGLLQVLPFMRAKKTIRQARLIGIGTLAEVRGKKLAPMLVASAYAAMIQKAYTTCEYSWVFKDNLISRGVASRMEHKAYKTYDVYGKKL